jgi:Family of unknown function (DUF6064)
MPLPFTRDAFLDVFAAYNERLWPFALVLWLATAYSFVALARATRVRSRFFPGLLAVHWAWAAVAYHAAFFSKINPAAWVFSGVFLFEAGLLAWYGVAHRRLRFSPVSSFRHVLSLGLIAYALLYPAIVAAEGHEFPRLPTFGVPCPTTILTVGFLLAANRPLPRPITLVPIAWAFIGGSAAFLLGVRADLMLLVAGVVLIVDGIARRDAHWLVWPNASSEDVTRGHR